MKKKVCVIGMGYVGFPLACAISSTGNYEVLGLDIDQKKIEMINKKISPIKDKIAEEEIKKYEIKGSVNFEDVKGSEFILICVPTPVKKTKEPDLSFIVNASKSIKPYLEKGQIIILESTVNPGVCEEIILPIFEGSGLKIGIDFDIVHCPERINPGDEKWNVYNLPRNIGGTSKDGTQRAANFYREFVKAEINEMRGLKEAEATKIVENSFRNINIAFANELAMHFDLLGIDILEVMNGAGNKPFAFMKHYPGCGVGGHCIPVDPYYLIENGKSLGFDNKFLKISMEVNNFMPEYTIKKLIDALNELGKSVKETRIGLLGLSYKSNVADLRESPALIIKEKLEKMGAKIFVCEPYIENSKTIEETLNASDVIIIATSHNEFLEIEDWKSVKLIIDGRNCLNKENIINKGIIYRGIGR